MRRGRTAVFPLAWVALAAAAPIAPAQVSVEVGFVPAAVEIGQPATCTLSITHPQGLSPRVARELELEDAWLSLRERRLATGPGPAAGLEVTRASWVLCSIEPGARSLVLPPVRYRLDGESRTLEPPAAVLTVAPALAEGEDAPRGWADFRRPPAGAGRSGLRRWGGLVVALLCAGIVAGVTLLALRLGRRAPARPPTAAERVRALKPEGEDAAHVRALHYELSRTVREVVDELAGADRRGATDPEWLALARAQDGVPAEAHARLVALLGVCERVKYAQELPTKWAVEETLSAGRALVVSLCPRTEEGAP